jgi:hypothetical protein
VKVALEIRERAENRRDRVIDAGVRGGEVAAVEHEAKEAEDGPARRFRGLDGGTHAHGFEPRQREGDADAFEKGAALDRLAVVEDVHGCSQMEK